MSHSNSKSISSGSSSPPAQPRGTGVKKKNLSLTDASLNTIEELKAETDAATTAEVVRRALAFYAMAVKKQKEGGSFLYRDRSGTDNAFIFL